MGWWNKAKATIKSGAKKVAKATQTDIGKLVTGQAFVEGGINTLSTASQMIQNPTAMMNSLPNIGNQEQSGDSSNTQALANPTSSSNDSSSSAASQQTEQGLKNMTGSSDNPGKYSSVNNGGVYYGL